MDKIDKTQIPTLDVEITSQVSLPQSAQKDIENISSVVQTVSVVPTWVPKKFYEQVVIYSSGATYRLYIYDTINNAWRYTTLT